MFRKVMQRTDKEALRSIQKSETDILLNCNGSLTLLMAGCGEMTILSLPVSNGKPSLITSTG